MLWNSSLLDAPFLSLPLLLFLLKVFSRDSSIDRFLLLHWNFSPFSYNPLKIFDWILHSLCLRLQKENHCSLFVVISFNDSDCDSIAQWYLISVCLTIFKFTNKYVPYHKYSFLKSCLNPNVYVNVPVTKREPSLSVKARL